MNALTSLASVKLGREKERWLPPGLVGVLSGPDAGNREVLMAAILTTPLHA
jgi:hypothetical protein